MTDPRRPPETSIMTLRILRLLERHFAHGLTNGDIAKAMGIAPSMVTRHIAALESEGYAERVVETGRFRPSVRLAQACYGILKSLDDASARNQELTNRITRA